MKISELLSIDITKEIYEAFDRVLTYKSIAHKIQNNTNFFLYEIENTKPLIKIQVKIKKIAEKMIGELSFFTDEFGFEQLNISSSGKALSIIATVADLAEKFIPQLDIIFFTCKLIVPDDKSDEKWAKAEKEVKTKSRIYSKLSRQLAIKNNLNYQSFTAKGDSGFILSKEVEILPTDIVKYYSDWG